MRTLKFIVRDQKITKDPDCDFSGLVAGSSGFLNCEFTFEGDMWKDLLKVVEFKTRYQKSDFFQIKDEPVNIPSNVTKGSYFRVCVHGVNMNTKTEVATDSVLIEQEV